MERTAPFRLVIIWLIGSYDSIDTDIYLLVIFWIISFDSSGLKLKWQDTCNLNILCYYHFDKALAYFGHLQLKFKPVCPKAEILHTTSACNTMCYIQHSNIYEMVVATRWPTTFSLHIFRCGCRIKISTFESKRWVTKFNMAVFQDGWGFIFQQLTWQRYHMNGFDACNKTTN